MIHHRQYVGVVLRNVFRVLISREFISLSILGNSIIFLFAYGFLQIESGSNPKVKEFLDALWFCYSTVTTVGYGDITPTTSFGRVIGIFLMLIGTIFFVTFTALFSNAILGSRMSQVEGQLKLEDKKLEELLKQNQANKLEEK